MFQARMHIALIVLVVLCAQPWALGADYDDNLGYRWNSSSPNGAKYNVALDGTAKNELVQIPGQVNAIPIKLKVDWDTMNEVKIKFKPATNLEPAPEGQTLPERQYDRFALSLEITNKTGINWTGFRFTLVDDNNTDYPVLNRSEVGGTLRHPFRAHFHTLPIKTTVDVDGNVTSSSLGFNQFEVIHKYYKTYDEVTKTRGGLTTGMLELKDNAGSYFVGLSNKAQTENPFTVKPNEVWKPLFRDAANPTDATKNSVLDFHIPDENTAQAVNTFAFTLILQPVPEPGALALLGVGTSLLLVWRRRA